MLKLKSIAAIVGMSLAPMAQGAAPTIVEVGQGQTPTSQYAQVCLKNASTSGDVYVWTNWGIGAAWYPVILGQDSEILYRLAAEDLRSDRTLKVRYVRHGSYDLVVETEMDVTVTAEPVYRCGAITRYELTTRRDETDGVILTKVPAGE